MGNIAVVTGANAGLGFEIARGLAARGMTVVMACRDLKKAEAARDRLLAEQPQASLGVRRLDVSDLESVREFGRGFSGESGGLQLLVNNAGIVDIPLARNRAGHELQLATNYLGPFALIGTLLPHFASGQAARIVNVNSNAHRGGELRLDDFNWERGRYRGMAAYARSKLALMTFTLELDRRLRASGSPIIALSAHPGWAATGIADHKPMANPSNPVGKWLIGQVKKIVPTAAQAARPSLHAACADGVRGGEYYGPGGFGEIAGETAPARINPKACEVESAGRLWRLSEDMTGVRYLSA
jgi:NAD(P)-dependent dehydrogenase (short-subunit alcohol dehydrogenase family)